jgi:hypothetical protein
MGAVCSTCPQTFEMHKSLVINPEEKVSFVLGYDVLG